MKIYEHNNSKLAKIIMKIMNKSSSSENFEAFGVSLWNHIFYWPAPFNVIHQAHERVHVEQMFEKWHRPITFWIIWIYDFLKNYRKYRNIYAAYRSIQFEALAYIKQFDKYYDPKNFDICFSNPRKKNLQN